MGNLTEAANARIAKIRRRQPVPDWFGLAMVGGGVLIALALFVALVRGSGAPEMSVSRVTVPPTPGSASPTVPDSGPVPSEPTVSTSAQGAVEVPLVGSDATVSVPAQAASLASEAAAAVLTGGELVRGTTTNAEVVALDPPLARAPSLSSATVLSYADARVELRILATGYAVDVVLVLREGAWLVHSARPA